MLLLTGDGYEKKLLRRRLIVGLSPARYDVALVAIPRCLHPNCLMRYLPQGGLGLVRSKAERLQTVNERLQLNSQPGITSVLVVNEA